MWPKCLSLSFIEFPEGGGMCCDLICGYFSLGDEDDSEDDC